MKTNGFHPPVSETDPYAPATRGSGQSDCAPAKTRTWTVGFEDRSDIRFTTGAYIHILP